MTKDNVLDSNIEVMKIVKAFNSNEFTKNMLNSWVVTIAKIDSLLKDNFKGILIYFLFLFMKYSSFSSSEFIGLKIKKSLFFNNLNSFENTCFPDCPSIKS